MLSKILAIIADMIAVLSLWGINGESTFFPKMLCTIFLLLVAFSVVWIDSDIAKIVDYSWEKDTQPVLFIKKNAYFKDNSLVSIYLKEDNKKTLAAIGFVINEEDEKNLQINVFKLISDGTMHKINNNKTNYKKFFVKPYVRYQDINGINFT